MATHLPRWARPWAFALGVLLIAVTPAVGVLPGPGGIFVFAAGVALVLKNSVWAKRRYVRASRRWPKLGGWMDWALRRPSPRRREARDGRHEIDSGPSSAMRRDRQRPAISAGPSRLDDKS